MTRTSVNQLLGYPDDARLLIINADDFGMSHSGNAATIKAFEHGILTSATLMMPCPWAPHAIELLRQHPNLPFGVHLTIVSEHDAMRWGPRASRDKVSSLVDDEGYFLRNSQSRFLLDQARLDEVEIEYRAQIEAVVATGLEPTHFDWHCLYDGGRDDIFDLTTALAREYGVAMRVHDPEKAERLISSGLPAVNRGVLDSYSVATEGKADTLTRLLRELPAGLSEWAVHPGLGDAEAQVMEPFGWRVRASDLDFLTSHMAKETFESENIILVSYRDIRAEWKR
ncbi:MAG: carbohydrate deacetylase [Thermomicrobiales bacterium]